MLTYTARPLWRCAALVFVSATKRLSCVLVIVRPHDRDDGLCAGREHVKTNVGSTVWGYGVTGARSLAVRTESFALGLAWCGNRCGREWVCGLASVAGSRSKNGAVAMFELYRAEFGKLVIIGVLCGCAFIALEDLNFAAFLGGLVLVTLASVVAAATNTVELPEQLGRQI